VASIKVTTFMQLLFACIYYSFSMVPSKTMDLTLHCIKNTIINQQKCHHTTPLAPH